MYIEHEVSTLNPYWVFYCAEHGIDPLVKLRTYHDFTGWINARHMEFQPDTQIRYTPEYIEAFTAFLANRSRPKPTEAEVLERLQNLA